MPYLEVFFSDAITRYMKYWNRYLMGGVNSMDCTLLCRKKTYILYYPGQKKNISGKHHAGIAQQARATES